MRMSGLRFFASAANHSSHPRVKSGVDGGPCGQCVASVLIVEWPSPPISICQKRTSSSQ
jgi:hypothetical protein